MNKSDALKISEKWSDLHGEMGPYAGILFLTTGRFIEFLYRNGYEIESRLVGDDESNRGK